MKLREIYFRELVNNTLQEKEYPFTSDGKLDWNLQDLGEHLFSPLSVLVGGQWVETFETDNDGLKIESTVREYKFPQF